MQQFMTSTEEYVKDLAPWQSGHLTAQERATALLAEMSLAEKIAQLGSSWPGGDDAGGDVAPMQETVQRARAFDDEIKNGLGQITRAFGTGPISPADGAKRLSDLQRKVQAANRFGLPAIAHEECLTGFTTWSATVYPTSLAWAATFDTALVQKMAANIGTDMAGVGVHQGLSPVLDVVRDYRWGRVEETLGEDPYLVGEMGAAYVTGLQSAGIVATLKHFAGYAASRGARNHAPVGMGRRELHDVILPPFEKAVRAGVKSVMNSYTETDGVPAASDSYLLQDVLRDEWGFTGTVVSDYWAIPFLETMHRTAATASDAGRQALLAGIDVELPQTLGYHPELLGDDAEVRAAIDRAALRVLTQKAELGLLDAGWSPSVPANEVIDLDHASNREVARQLAEESIVLLENPRGMLPINSAPGTIALIGPGIEDSGCFFGCYSFPNHVVPNHPGTSIGITAPTLAESVRAAFPESELKTAQGTTILGTDCSGIPEAARLAGDADLTIVMVGDRSGMFGHGTSGEGCDALDLHLPGAQEELLEAVLGASQNVILICVSGRPYAIGDFAKRAAAALQVFFPGEEGGKAIAAVLSGETHPSGRLPVQIPGSAASQPGTYLAPPLALKSDGVSNIDPSPAYPFGYGLSYSEVVIEGVSASADSIGLDGRVEITARLRNTGVHKTTHVPQLYVSHRAASVTRPVKRLIGFTRVEVPAGAEATVRFTVHADVTSFIGRDYKRRVEPGVVTFTVGNDAGDTGFGVEASLTGEGPRHVGHNRVLDVPATVI
jgi:beta-xylosidase